MQHTFDYRTLGFWSALLVTVTGVGYGAAAAAALATPATDWWGNNMSATPGALYVSFAFAFAGIPLMTLLMVCIHCHAPAARRVLTLAALVFTGVYAALLTVVYAVQLTVVRWGVLQGQTAGLELFAYQHTPSVMFAVDIYGYLFLGLATLLVAPVFSGRGLERAIRWSLGAHGLSDMAGVVGLTLEIGWLMDLYLYVMSASLLAAAVLLSIFFRRAMPQAA